MVSGILVRGKPKDAGATQPFTHLGYVIFFCLTKELLLSQDLVSGQVALEQISRMSPQKRFWEFVSVGDEHSAELCEPTCLERFTFGCRFPYIRCVAGSTLRSRIRESPSFSLFRPLLVAIGICFVFERFLCFHVSCFFEGGNT